MAIDDGFGRRVLLAYLVWAARVGRAPTQAEFGRVVGKKIDGKPRDSTTVGRWFDGTRPDHATEDAIADVAGVNRAWLKLGPDYGPAPELPQQASPLPRKTRRRASG